MALRDSFCALKYIDEGAFGWLLSAVGTLLYPFARLFCFAIFAKCCFSSLSFSLANFPFSSRMWFFPVLLISIVFSRFSKQILKRLYLPLQHFKAIRGKKKQPSAIAIMIMMTKNAANVLHSPMLTSSAVWKY